MQTTTTIATVIALLSMGATEASARVLCAKRATTVSGRGGEYPIDKGQVVFGLVGHNSNGRWVTFHDSGILLVWDDDVTDNYSARVEDFRPCVGHLSTRKLKRLFLSILPYYGYVTRALRHDQALIHYTQGTFLELLQYLRFRIGDKADQIALNCGNETQVRFAAASGKLLSPRKRARLCKP